MDHEGLLRDHSYEDEVLDILFERSRRIVRAMSQIVGERRDLMTKLEQRDDNMSVFEVLECDCRLTELDRLLPLFEIEEKFIDWLIDEILGAAN